MQKTLDLETIRIDQRDLLEISKSNRESQEQRQTKNSEFNTEIMSIIGSINSRANMLKTKFSMKKTNELGQTIDTDTDQISETTSLLHS